MGRDRWEDAYCWHIQATFGAVAASRVPEVVTRWVDHCFTGRYRPRVRILLATRAGTPIEPDPHQPAADWPLIRIDDDAAHAARIYNWFGSLGRRDSDEILLVVAENSLAVNYSHKFGDEATIYPITRRLWLELSGRDPELAPALLPDDERVGSARIVAAATRLAAGHPRETLAAVRRLGARTAGGRLGRDDGHTAADEPAVTGGWVLFARVLAPPSSRSGRLPSIPFFAHLLTALDLPPEVQHSILTDLRPYSPLLAGRAGNAIGPISFTTDPRVDDPNELAADLARRVRSGESLVRVAAGIVAGSVIAARAKLRGRPVGDPSAGDRLTTSCSHVRLPEGQDTTDDTGGIPRMAGMMAPVPHRLTINTRETAGVSDMTFGYLGSEITVDRVHDALKAVEVSLDTRIVSIDSFPYRQVGLPTEDVA